MKYILITVYMLVISCLSVGQTTTITLSGGVAFNGTGDTKGPIYNTEFTHFIKKSNFFWSASLGGSIHDGSFPIFYEYPAGRFNDGSIKYTIAGLQTLFHIGKDFIKSKQNEVYVKIGSVIRYQSSSYWDVVSVLYEPITNIPFPVVVFENSTPQKTLAIGPSLQTGYSYIFNKKLLWGIMAAMQTDTQGDIITSLQLKIGRVF